MDYKTLYRSDPWLQGALPDYQIRINNPITCHSLHSTNLFYFVNICHYKILGSTTWFFCLSARMQASWFLQRTQSEFVEWRNKENNIKELYCLFSGGCPLEFILMSNMAYLQPPRINPKQSQCEKKLCVFSHTLSTNSRNHSRVIKHHHSRKSFPKPNYFLLQSRLYSYLSSHQNWWLLC